MNVGCGFHQTASSYISLYLGPGFNSNKDNLAMGIGEIAVFLILSCTVNISMKDNTLL